MIKKREVKVFEAHLHCDKCGAEMHHTGRVLYSHPLQYVMVCSCGLTCNTQTKYPHLVYEAVEEKKEDTNEK